MKIIHVVPCSEKSIAGIERHALYLANAQKARGSTVMMVTDHPGVFSEACQQHDIPVLVVAGLVPSREPLGRMSEPAVRELIDFKSFSADVVHCHTLQAAAKAVPAANLAGIPCVITFNGARPLIEARKAGMRFVVICKHREIYERMKESAFPEKDLYYVPNGTKVAPAASRGQAGGSIHPNLIAVGRLEWVKAIEVAILAMAELRRRRGRECPVLNIYGDGDLRDYLMEITAVLELDNIVRFHGSQLGILERCPSTDILIMSSRSELGPMVVPEAMSRGMPIVATDVGQVAEMLPDRRYGRIVPIESIVPLADAVESLLSDIEDGQFTPELLIERHREFYSDDKMAERVEVVYEQAILYESATGPGPAGGVSAMKSPGVPPW
jgi:glycosyltransferase involved in cell wall biosynthesis